MPRSIKSKIANLPAARRRKISARAAELKNWRELQIEHDNACDLIHRQALLLTGVVNALRGEPPPDTSWSHHDAAELAQKAVRRVTQLEDLLRRVNVRMGRALLGLSVAVRSTEGASGEEEVIDPIMEEIADTLAPPPAERGE